LEDAINKIRDELNRAVREGYTKDYEELIIKYYESLQEEGSGN
jgi:predicted glycosyltransferase